MTRRRIRAWITRLMLVVAALAVLTTTMLGVKLFDHACDGSLEGLRTLTNVRRQIVAATAPPPAPAPATPTPALAASQPAPPTPTPPPGPTVTQRVVAGAGAAGDAAIAVILKFKQSDVVAYPAHIAAAYTLDAAGCGKDAVRLQWLKAGLHTAREDRLAWIADRLRASATGPDDLDDLRRVVRVWSERAGESVALRRVLSALEEQPS
ncbi:MAG: hypothetical protein U0893_22425 [Chloroflexota bacterium]